MPAAVPSWLSAIALALGVLLLFTGQVMIGVVLLVVAVLFFIWYAKT